jgi:hypothetical protein
VPFLGPSPWRGQVHVRDPLTLTHAHTYTHPHHRQKNAGHLFRLLIDICGKRYLEAAVDLFLEDYLALDLRTEAHLRQLTVLHVGNRLLQVLQMHFQYIIVRSDGGSEWGA